jgi:hypothetical protein
MIISHTGVLVGLGPARRIRPGLFLKRVGGANILECGEPEFRDRSSHCRQPRFRSRLNHLGGGIADTLLSASRTLVASGSGTSCGRPSASKENTRLKERGDLGVWPIRISVFIGTGGPSAQIKRGGKSLPPLCNALTLNTLLLFPLRSNYQADAYFARRVFRNST